MSRETETACWAAQDCKLDPNCADYGYQCAATAEREAQIRAEERTKIAEELRAEARRVLSLPADLPPDSFVLLPRQGGKTYAAGLENAAAYIEMAAAFREAYARETGRTTP